jgi:hypothetical protein
LLLVVRFYRFHPTIYAVLDKFRILGLVEYRRVLLMDGDVMPNTSLDYLFEMSDGENATLKENLITAGKMEPANAVSLRLFLLTAPIPVVVGLSSCNFPSHINTLLFR